MDICNKKFPDANSLQCCCLIELQSTEFPVLVLTPKFYILKVLFNSTSSSPVVGTEKAKLTALELTPESETSFDEKKYQLRIEVLLENKQIE